MKYPHDLMLCQVVPVFANRVHEIDLSFWFAVETMSSSCEVVFQPANIARERKWMFFQKKERL